MGLLKLAHLKDSSFGKWIRERYYDLSPSYQTWAAILFLLLIVGYLFL